MPLHDFKCANGHVHEELLSIHWKSEESMPCTECDKPSFRVFLTPPRIDWAGMAQGDNAGPEFVARFDKVHQDKAEKERRCWNEHGDYGAGTDTVMPRQPGEDPL